MNLTVADHVIEATLSQEDRIVAAVSDGTLAYMYWHGLAREYRLRNHRGDLEFAREEGRDLFEGMRLAERLRTVDKNIQGAGRRNERLRSEIVRREADRGSLSCAAARPYALFTGGERWDEDIVGESGTVAGGG